eukprot:1099442-Pyramimonas_sp.AAC.1
MRGAPYSSFSACSSPIRAVSPISSFLCLYSLAKMCYFCGGVGTPPRQGHFDANALGNLSESTSRGIGLGGLLR